MKKYILSLIAIICFSASAFCQTEKTGGALGCVTDCFFTDCTVSCPPNTIPKCKCILGSFGSCGCQQMYTKAGGTDQLPNAKNQTIFPKVIDQLNKAGYSSYANNLSVLFSALSAKDAVNYQRYYSTIEAMVAADPAEADRVQNIISGNFR